MTADAIELACLQRWMQTVITHPDGIGAGINSASARRDIDVTSATVEQVISRSRALNSLERLAVYGNAYYARLIECLAAEFPATRQAVGEEAFSGFVFGYLQEFPSTSYTLGDLGSRFPSYLSNSRPQRTGEDPDWADFVVDLATLERLYSDVFDGPGEEHQPKLTAEDLQAIPPQQWGDVRLITAKSLRLIELRFPAQEYIASARQGHAAAIPSPQPTRLAINRREYIVRRRTLTTLPFDLLTRLQQGAPLGQAIADSVAGADDAERLDERLQTWFRDWTAAGYFIGVRDT